MVKFTASIAALFIALSLTTSSSLADVNEFKDTVWNGSSEEEKNAVLTISQEFHWNFSFTDEAGNRQQYSGVGAIESTLFAGEQHPANNPLVLILMKDGAVGAHPMAIIREGGKTKLFYDELALTKIEKPRWPNLNPRHIWH